MHPCLLEAEHRLRPEVTQLEQGAEGASDVHQVKAGDRAQLQREVRLMAMASVCEPGPLTREELVRRGGLHMRGEEVSASCEFHETVLDGGALIQLQFLGVFLGFDGMDMAGVRRQQVAQAGVGELVVGILVLEENELRGDGKLLRRSWRHYLHLQEMVTA